MRGEEKVVQLLLRRACESWLIRGMKLLMDETMKIATEVVELSASMPRRRVARISLPPSSSCCASR